LKTSMNAEPALVERTSRSLKFRRNSTAGEASEPNVAVAIMHLGGLKGTVVVLCGVVGVTGIVVADVASVVVVAAGIAGKTVKLAHAVSPDGPLVTLTMYDPATAAAATLNEAVIEPSSTTHAGACSSVFGFDERPQVVSLEL
jgi:hypothetical protein